MTPTTARALDQFYTQGIVAQRLCDVTRRLVGSRKKFLEHHWIEPSAGTGAFFGQLPTGSIGLDLAPAAPGIKQADFLTWTPPTRDKRPLGVIGNPPFGKNASLAVAFVNRAAAIGAEWVAMILPRSFEKASIQNRIDPFLHLLHEEVLPTESFVYEGSPYSVPCVFQVWQRRSVARAKVTATLTHPDFEFLPYESRSDADFVLQRVGCHAGRVKNHDEALGQGSHQWIRATDRNAVAQVRQRLTSIDWTGVKHRTAGNPSISKGEIVELYSKGMTVTPSAQPARALTVYDRITAMEQGSMSYAQRKKTGVIYTPLATVRAMVRLARPEPHHRILEISVGRGAFLFGIIEYFVIEQNWSYQQAATWAEGHLFAQDIDPVAISDIRSLWKWYFAEHGVTSDLGDNLRVRDALFDDCPERYDLVIGNPPYLGGGSLKKDVRAKLKARFKASAFSNGDMYYAFVERAMEIADRTCLLIPRTWMNAYSAAPLRAMLKPKLRAVVDFGAKMLFGPDVFTLVSVIVTGPDTMAPLLHRIDMPEESNTPWTVWYREDKGLTDKYRFNPQWVEPHPDNETLSDLVHIDLDILTGHNPSYRLEAPIIDGRVTFTPPAIKGKGKPIVTDKAFLATEFSAPAHLAPRFLKMTRVKSLKEALTQDQRILFPYDERFAVIPENQLDAGLSTWFDACQEDLNARNGGDTTKIKGAFYAYSSRQGFIDLPPDERVILIPNLTANNEAFNPIAVTAHEVGGRFLVGSGYMLRLKDPRNLDLVMSILRSNRATNWVSFEATLRKADYRSFSARLLRNMPTGRKRPGAIEQEPASDVKRRKTWFERIAELEREAGVPPSFTEEEAMSAVRKLGPITAADTLHVQGCARGALMLALVQVLNTDQQWSHVMIKNWAEKSLFGSCTDETGLRVLKVLWTGYFGSLGCKSHIAHNVKCVKVLPAKWKGKTFSMVLNAAQASEAPLPVAEVAPMPEVTPVPDMIFDAIKEKERTAVKRIQNGVFYTPPEVAASMIRIARIQENDIVLEPSCGAGVFFFGIALHLVNERGWTYEKTARWAETHLFGADLDQDALDDLAALWTSFFAKHGVRSCIKANLRCGDSIFGGWSDRTDFSLIIGNPPYVAWPNIDAVDKARLRTIPSCASGQADLYYAFMSRALTMAPRSCLIVPHTWLRTKSATVLRSEVKPRLRALIDCGSRMLFGKGVNTTASIVLCGPETLAPILHRTNLPEEGGAWSVTFRNDPDLTPEQWVFGSPFVKTLGNAETLADLAHVHVPVITGNDHAYKVRVTGLTGRERVGFQGELRKFRGTGEFSGPVFTSPENLVPRFLRLTQYKTLEDVLDERCRLLCPYDVNGLVIAEASIDAGALAFLKTRRAMLDAREGGSARRPFYAFNSTNGVMDFAPDQPLILIPDRIRKTISPIVVTPRELGGRFAFISGYVLEPKNPADLDRIVALLKSQDVFDWIAKFGKAIPIKNMDLQPWYWLTAEKVRNLPAVFARKEGLERDARVSEVKTPAQTM